MHGEQPGLEPGRLVERLGPPVAGEGGAVHAVAPLLPQPDQGPVQQEPAHPHAPGSLLHEARTEPTTSRPASVLIDGAHGEGHHHLVQHAHQHQGVVASEQHRQPFTQPGPDRLVQSRLHQQRPTPLAGHRGHQLAGQLDQPLPVMAPSHPHRLHGASCSVRARTGVRTARRAAGPLG